MKAAEAKNIPLRLLLCPGCADQGGFHCCLVRPSDIEEDDRSSFFKCRSDAMHVAQIVQHLIQSGSSSHHRWLLSEFTFR